ncbi:MAG: hypothetical protein ACFHWZ_09605 [Phycisphaerales bacterium]
MQANLVVRAEAEHLLLRDRDARAGTVVVRIAERNDGVQAVVPAGQLDHDKHVLVRHAGDRAPARGLHRHRRSRPLEEQRDRHRGRGHHQTRVQELPAGPGFAVVKV